MSISQRRAQHKAFPPWFAALASAFSLLSAPATSQGAENADADLASHLYIDFEYNAASGCPSAAHGFALVQGRSRRVRQAQTEPPQQLLNMTITSDGDGYRGVLTVRRPGEDSEKRAMTGPHCDEVVEALALTAALSIDPNATLTVGTDADVTTGGPTSGADTASEERLRPDVFVDKRAKSPSRAASSDDLLFSLGALLQLQKAMRHSPHLGVGLALGLRRDNGKMFFPLEASVTLRAAFETSARNDPSIRTRLYLAQISYCPLRLGARLALLLCPTLDLGLLHANARGFDDATDATRFLLMAGAEAKLRARIIDSLSLWLSPSLAFPLTRRQFSVNPNEELITSTVDVAWGVASGLAWDF